MAVSSSRCRAAVLATLVVGCGSNERPPPGLGSWGAVDPATSSDGVPDAEDAGTSEADPQGAASSTSGTDSTSAGATTGSDGPGSSSSGSSAIPPSTTASDLTSGRDSTSTTGRGADDDDASSSSGVVGSFDPGQPFGDDQAELDIVGTWGLPRYGFPQSWEARLTITAAGDVSWVEHGPQCEIVTEAFGQTWIENNQLVLHFDSYLGALPWPTEEAIGRSIEAPFRVRLGYAPAGLTLGLSAPPGWTTTAPWEGRGLIRQTRTSGPEGSWASESQLEGLVPGSATSEVILVDRYDLELRPDGSGLSTMRRTYAWPQTFVEPPVYRDAAWVDGTPGNLAGEVAVSGRPFAYDTVRILSFGQWDALSANPNLRCS